MACISVTGIASAAPTGASATSRARTPKPHGVLLLAAGLLTMGASPVARLEVGVDQLRSAKGLLRICLTSDPDSFPACVGDAHAVVRNVPAGTTTIHFDGLPHRNYAMALIHDENGNHKLDTFAGIPREGFGFSRNPAIGFGPPRFSAARFAVARDAERQQVRMRYML